LSREGLLKLVCAKLKGRSRTSGLSIFTAVPVAFLHDTRRQPAEATPPFLDTIFARCFAKKHGIRGASAATTCATNASEKKEAPRMACPCASDAMRQYRHANLHFSE
jgi:hypothetical protein